VILIVSVPLLADIALSGVVPGASDNASGVATVLRLADRYGEQLDTFDVWVLLTGAQESMQLGMSAFLRRHAKELDTSSTVFLCVDDVGNGTIRYATKEGYILGLPYHPDLTGLCDQLREEDADDGFYRARPISPRIPTDAWRARAKGYPAIAISCLDDADLPPNYHQPSDTPANIDPEALERAYDFCSELIELIDERIGPRLDHPVGSAA
jgi:Iap family predicted aminopeptidase